MRPMSTSTNYSGKIGSTTTPPNNSLEATWDAVEFAIGGALVISRELELGNAQAPQLAAVGRYTQLEFE